MRNRLYKWFIEPLDAHTNAIIAKELSEENAFRGVPDNEGKKRDVWLLGNDAQKVRAFVNSKKALGLKFNVFVQENSGKMRLVNFLFWKNKKR